MSEPASNVLVRGGVKGIALRVGAAIVVASLFVMIWARQTSVLFFLFWLLVLVLPGASTAAVMWALSRRRGPAAIVRILLGVAIGTLGVYVEAFICSAFWPNLFSNPMASSNIVPGVVIGILVTHFIFGFAPAQTT